MLDLPARAGLAAISQALKAIVPVAAFGFTRRLGDNRVSIVHSYGQGLGQWIVSDDALPRVVEPSPGEIRQDEMQTLVLDPAGAFERFLHDQDVTRVASIPVANCTRPTRFWLGLSGTQRLSETHLDRLTTLANGTQGLFQATPEEQVAQLRRLELAAGVLPTLLEVLDVRDVFDRMSAVAKQALPHDLLLVVLFSDDLSTFSVYARSDRGTDHGPTLPTPYPAATIRAYTFAIFTDHLAHPFERHAPATKLGARSSLRVPIRIGDRVIGSLGFASFEPDAYGTGDVAVARRLADHVAVGLSHHELAEEGRRAAALRERAANLDLLDELLSTIVEGDDVSEVFGRVSAAASKVLHHDGATLAVRLPDGVHGRVYASSGFPAGLPETIEIPEDLRRNPKWDHHIFDDLTLRTEKRYLDFAALGFRSMLRVPIRREGEFAAALLFLSNTPAAFQTGDIAVARRIADRLAVALARDRELAAAKRADEATERASQLEARVRALTDELNARSGFRRVIGESPPWRQVLTQATQVSSTATTVLLLGESGTGKEVIARFLHRGSQRSGGPFVALNCAALPEQLLEAELFGYERGAFTGAVQSKPGQLEQASGGTLFLDEVGEMSPSAQAKFLRVLQEREFQRLGGTRVLRTDARIVAATNRDLLRDIANGKFREDLYYRLNVFAIKLPPLRDRRDDILQLSEEFMAEVGKGLGRPPAGISRDARQMLLDYQWPGNVRELRNILERAAILCDGGLITAEHLALTAAPPAVRPSPAPAQRDAAAPEPAMATPPTAAGGDLNSMERTMIEQALQSARFNKSKAAKTLGLTRHQLYIRMRKHGLD
jgi:transcriptional regulator with GAF, ATPase, and Fis domain